MKKISLHTQILVGMVLGALCAFISIKVAVSTAFIISYIKPIGTIFFNSLKMVAIPLTFSSIIVSIANMQGTATFARIGRKTFLIYLSTTFISAGIGLSIAHFVKPGSLISSDTRESLCALYGHTNFQLESQNKLQVTSISPLQFFLTLIPENFFCALTSNLNLLQVVVVSILLGIALLKIVPQKRVAVVTFFEGIYAAVIQLISMIMQFSPIGVFALVFSQLVELLVGNDKNGLDFSEVFCALLGYIGTVLSGLLIVVFVLYPLILRLFTPIRLVFFLKGIYPAQLVALSSSSSSATLPVLIKSVEKNLGVPEAVSSFVLPLGSTINMNGTAVYQAVICLFITQLMGIELSFASKCMILGKITLSSIGVAAAPGSALVMAMVILQSLGIPAAWLALILAPDRILDMCRTVVNITGDALAAVVITYTEVKNELKKPHSLAEGK